MRKGKLRVPISTPSSLARHVKKELVEGREIDGSAVALSLRPGAPITPNQIHEIVDSATIELQVM